MTNEAFRNYAHQVADWMADYLAHIGDFPVRPALQPGDIKAQLPAQAPIEGEAFEQIFADFRHIILPGITHWQHPQFFAYFPTGGSMPSLLADMLISSLGVQCMVWLTSPAAAELEERMMEWLRDALGLPSDWTGVIQDGSSSATFVAMLTAREQKSAYSINSKGFSGAEKYRIYTSDQAHSSVDKGVKMAGIGWENLVKIPVDANFAMIPAELEAAILRDIQAGFTPLCVVSTVGSTSSCAIDPVAPIAHICRKYHCWHHIDASYAGTALLLPEMRWMCEGMELADSFVVNPHKWMFTHFDCSAYFIRDKDALIRTFRILPEYLKTPEDELVNNYRDWGIPLGRRFRALKLWFVMRSFGLVGMQQIIRNHIQWGQELLSDMQRMPEVEILAPAYLNLICFRFKPIGNPAEADYDQFNERLLQRLNNSGKILLTQTRLQGKYAIRFVAGQTSLQKADIEKGWQWIRDTAMELYRETTTPPE